MNTLYIKWSVLRRESCSFQMVKNHTQASRGLQSCCILPRCCLEHAWVCNRCQGRMSMWPRTTPQLTAEWHQETWLLRVATGSKNALFEVIVCCLGCPGSIEKRNCDHLSQVETQRIYSKLSKPSAQNIISYASDFKKCLFHPFSQQRKMDFCNLPCTKEHSSSSLHKWLALHLNWTHLKIEVLQCPKCPLGQGGTSSLAKAAMNWNSPAGLVQRSSSKGESRSGRQGENLQVAHPIISIGSTLLI